MIVVDASLGVKWFLDEAGSQEAVELLQEHRKQIAAPDLFGIEVAAALVREVNSRRDDPSRFSWELARLFALFESQAVELRRVDFDTLANATSLALDIGHPLKDCIYLALAVEIGCDLVTCDARFAAKAKSVSSSIRLISG
ncbi:MAG: type II toxin-antitoxin system VapC family toxin [Novosphingobium sp.]